MHLKSAIYIKFEDMICISNQQIWLVSNVLLHIEGRCIITTSPVRHWQYLISECDLGTIYYVWYYKCCALIIPTGDHENLVQNTFWER